MATRSTARFQGFPPEAVAFYTGLEADNSRGYWQAHRATYEEAVRAPMAALAAEVPEEYRPLRLFRPHRDTRFSKDKTPYKTQCAAVGEREGGSLLYVALSADGLLVGTGYYAMAGDQLARFRAAVDGEAAGTELAAAVDALERRGYAAGAQEELKTAPRGYPKDHPRVRLLRRKGLIVTRSWPPGPWLGTRQVLARVERVCADASPITAWLDAHVGPSEQEPDERDLR